MGGLNKCADLAVGTQQAYGVSQAGGTKEANGPNKAGCTDELDWADKVEENDESVGEDGTSKMSGEDEAYRKDEADNAEETKVADDEMKIFWWKCIYISGFLSKLKEFFCNNMFIVQVFLNSNLFLDFIYQAKFQTFFNCNLIKQNFEKTKHFYFKFSKKIQFFLNLFLAFR